MAVSGAINRQNMAISGAINRQNMNGHSDTALQRIASYHCHIDGTIQEMKECETRIDEYRGRVKAQQALIRTRREEAVTLKLCICILFVSKQERAERFFRTAVGR